MKRLTEKNESPCTCCGGIGSCRTDCSYKQLYDRLAEYEDTGLTPKEIEDMVSVREITPEAEYAIDKHANNLIQKLEQLIAQTDEKNELQRYKEAEEQGLLVWLPCKLGDAVYVTEPRYYNGAVHTGIQYGKVYGFEFDEEWVVWVHLADDNPHSGNAYPIADIGKTVFLTQEAAEKALEEA